MLVVVGTHKICFPKIRIGLNTKYDNKNGICSTIILYTYIFINLKCDVTENNKLIKHIHKIKILLYFRQHIMSFSFQFSETKQKNAINEINTMTDEMYLPSFLIVFDEK